MHIHNNYMYTSFTFDYVSAFKPILIFDLKVSLCILFDEMFNYF